MWNVSPVCLGVKGTLGITRCWIMPGRLTPTHAAGVISVHPCVCL